MMSCIHGLVGKDFCPRNSCTPLCPVIRKKLGEHLFRNGDLRNRLVEQQNTSTNIFKK